MKKLVVFVAVFVSSISFAQRDENDRKNIIKYNQVNDTITKLLTGSVSEKDIVNLGNYLYRQKPKNDEIQFISLINPALTKLNEDPSQKVDNHYFSESFRVLVGKTNVKVELTMIEDYYPVFDPKEKVSYYILNYKIYFKDNNSFGTNVDNYIDFNVCVCNSDILTLMHQIRYI
jgi:hypothetical protein